MTEIIPRPSDYGPWLSELKARIHAAQQRAARTVNSELVLLYWQIGRGILERQGQEGWGAKVIERLAQDLRNTFPAMKGFSPRKLKYMRAFAQAWPDPDFVQALLAQLPWYHQITLLDKLNRAQLVAQRVGDPDRDPPTGAQRSGRHQFRRSAAGADVRPGA